MTFTVPGKPVPQARPRVTGKGWAYTPKKSRIARNTVATYARIARQRATNSILGPDYCGRLKVTARFFGAHHNADLDNLYKLVTDACQGILYKDDNQIDQSVVYRHECMKGDERTEIEITEGVR